MKIKVNNHGYHFIEFLDQYRSECSLQESSLASPACIWLGVMQHGPQLEEIPSPVRMHLTQKQVKGLLPYLQAFADFGCLRKKIK